MRSHLSVSIAIRSSVRAPTWSSICRSTATRWSASNMTAYSRDARRATYTSRASRSTSWCRMEMSTRSISLSAESTQKASRSEIDPLMMPRTSSITTKRTNQRTLRSPVARTSSWKTTGARISKNSSCRKSNRKWRWPVKINNWCKRSCTRCAVQVASERISNHVIVYVAVIVISKSRHQGIIHRWTYWLNLKTNYTINQGIPVRTV